MVYPNSPYTDKFSNSIITYLNNKNIVEISEEIICDILKWICKTPNVSSFRVNTLKSNVETVKQLLEQSLVQVAETQCKSHCIPDVSIHPILSDVILINSYPKHELDLTLCEKEVIVDSACGSSVLRGAHVFSPGVMAMQSGTKLNDRVSLYADTSKKCKKGFKDVFDAGSTEKIFVGNGIVKMVRSQLFGEYLVPAGIAVQITDSISGCPSLNESNLPVGVALLQNIPSIVCGHVLNPKPGDLVLDMCAAPGNKTSHLAALMKNEGILIALDKTPNKLKQLEQKCKDFSLDCVTPFMYDSTKSCDVTLSERTSWNRPPFCPNSFNKILLDAPCSGLGNRPQLINTITDKVVLSYVALQRNLFRNAVLLLKPGGDLIYSTCTITLGENEGIVAWALDNFKCLELVAAEPILGGPGWPGTNLKDEHLKLLQRFGPNQSDSIGFFIAHFIKKNLHVSIKRRLINKK